MSKRLSPYLTLDDVSGLIGLKKGQTRPGKPRIHGQFMEDYDDFFLENNYCSCSEELQDQGKCECSFDQERSDLFDRYQAAVLAIAETLLKEHGLKLEATKKSWRWKLTPIVSWKHAATQVMNTIEGYGRFGYNHNLKEFLDSGPYTPFQAVMEHTHWLKEYYQVYGEVDASSQLDRRMR